MGEEMSIEPLTITVQAYRDEDGHPTCAADFPQGHVCQFLGVRKFGTQDTCLAKNTDVFRRFSGPPYGFLVPVEVAKRLILLVGAPGLERGTPCAPCNHRIHAQRFDLPPESQAPRLTFYALGIALEAACLLGCCLNISRLTRVKTC